MVDRTYGKNIVTELCEKIELPPEQAWKAIPGRGMINGRRRTMEHMVWMDSNVIPGAFYCEAVWLWPDPECDGAQQAGQRKSSLGVPPTHTRSPRSFLIAEQIWSTRKSYTARLSFGSRKKDSCWTRALPVTSPPA